MGIAAIGAVVLSALGHAAWFVLRTLWRPRARSATPAAREAEPLFPPRTAQELLKCLELGDCVARDASVLASSLAAQAEPLDGKLSRAASQLLRSAGALTRRLRLTIEPIQRQSGPRAVMPADVACEPLPNDQDAGDADVDGYAKLASLQLGRRVEKTDAELRDARKFPRKKCAGTAKATIYPSPISSHQEQIQCSIDLRSISCGGLSFFYEERLYPQQIVVIDVAGKLLIGEIRWCKRSDKGYLAGCKLVKASG